MRTPFVREWLARESETQDSPSDEPIIGRTFFSGAEIPIQRFACMPPNIHATGDIESMSLLAGESVGLIDEIRHAAENLRETINGAERLIRELSATTAQTGSNRGVPGSRQRRTSGPGVHEKSAVNLRDF